MPATVHLLRIATVLILAISVCTFLDRPDIKGFGFNYLEAVPRGWQVGFASRRDPDLVNWVRNQVVLVAISESTFDTHNPRSLRNVLAPPVPRDFHARVIDRLTRAGARVIAFDLIFDLPTVPQRDLALADAARRSGRVLWATVLDEKQSPPKIILPIAPLLEASSHLGHIDVPQNSERPQVDSVRPVVQDANIKLLPAFGIEAALMAMGNTGHWVPLPNGWQNDGLTVPLDSQGFSRVNYRGWSGDAGDVNREGAGATPYRTLSGSTHNYFYPRIPYEDLANGKVDLSLFRDKIVIIGDVTAVGNDFRNTTLGYMWGPEIHAQVATSVLMARQGYPMVREAGPALNLLVLSCLAGLVCFVAASWRLQSAALSATLLLLVYGAVNLWIFAHFALSLHMVAPTAAVILVLLGMLTERGLTEEREKRRMKVLLQRYLSEELAEYVTTHPEKSFLDGERVMATVLFSDIRGFTSLAENLPPEDVLRFLNEYMEAMTEVVDRYGGFVDKFIGDGIMALFGVPTSNPHHALQAVAAAIDMQNELVRIQRFWTDRGMPAVDMGVGINTGEMVFGNYGSSRRSDFSVIGDSVNVASRVESQNKDWGTRILVTETTYAEVKNNLLVRGPLPAFIRGKSSAVNLYEVHGWSDGIPPEIAHQVVPSKATRRASGR